MKITIGENIMGYNSEEIERDICETLYQYQELRKINTVQSQEWILEAYKKYPNDYRVMSAYMWNIAGDYADNDPQILLNHREEFKKICDSILNGCTDIHIRLDAYKYAGENFIRRGTD